MLYLAATPIGNLGDITYRTVETLKSCQEIWCEDTRRTGQLLAYLQIKKPLISCHEFTERNKLPLLAEKLKAGMDIVYVSDAGMPGISDPGALLLQKCIEEQLPCTVLPGASAVLTAAVLSGLPPQPFTFFGFLPRENKERQETLKKIGETGHLAILYESPHRVKDTLKEALEAFGDCRGALLRELTKLHEECVRGTLSEILGALPEEVRGECVLCLLIPQKKQAQASTEDLDRLLQELLSHMSLKDAAAEAAEALNLPKKQVYARALTLKQ